MVAVSPVEAMHCQLAMDKYIATWAYRMRTLAAFLGEVSYEESGAAGQLPPFRLPRSP